MTDKKQPEALAFCWATELEMTQQPVTLSVTEAREVSAEMQRLHAENTALQQGYAAARLEIESLQSRIKTMAEEHSDEMTAAHLDGKIRAAQVMPESIRSILVRCRNFIDTTKVPEYPAGADLADEIDAALLAAQPATAQQPAPSAAAVQTIPGVQWQCGPQASGFTAPQADSQPAPAAVAGPSDTFRGDTTCLVQSIIALLELDAEGALVPHGIGGHARALLSAAASRLAAAPTTQPAPQQEAPAMPSGWVSCTIEFDGSGPEEVAYGPKIMMDRLAKWLGKHFERTIAEKAAPQPSPASQGDALDAERLDWLNEDDENHVSKVGKTWYTRPAYGRPYRKHKNLRAAIDAARAAQEGK